ncbi:MAG: phenylalanine--tRNA ligase beta subunit-related protein [Bacilli bacterium]|nr:phenylalanine--tRNA ligase beta subunit-related protein [Bacilli bacterium]
MFVRISNSLLKLLPDFDVIAHKLDVDLKGSEGIKPLIKSIEKEIMEEYSLADVLNIPLIKEARDAYKTLGKDPSRYRLACESLLRRLVKGKGLYTINNLVDAGNVLSIKTNRSVAVLDYDKIVGNVEIRIGTKNDEYYGIGRGKLNVTDIPIYVDEVGPFGSTTSDTERTAISDTTKTILLFIICFSDTYKAEHTEYALRLYQDYANARKIERINIRKD